MSDEVMENILTPKKFEQLIEDIVWELDISHFDAVLKYCERHDQDPQDIAKLVNKNLKEKLHFDAIADGYLVKPSQLPL